MPCNDTLISYRSIVSMRNDLLPEGTRAAFFRAG